MTKIAYYPPAVMVDQLPLLVNQAVYDMTPEQFHAYDAALRAVDYYTLPADDRENYLTAIRAANQRRAAEGFNVTIRDGNRSDWLANMPAGWWIPLAAIGLVLAINAARN